MSVFQVIESQDATLPEAERATIIEDRFSWGAFLVTPLWTLYHHMWRETLIWAAMTACSILISLFLGAEAGCWVYVLACLYAGVDAAAIRSRALVQKGDEPKGDLVIPNLEQAEQEWVRQQMRIKVAA